MQGHRLQGRCEDLLNGRESAQRTEPAPAGGAGLCRQMWLRPLLPLNTVPPLTLAALLQDQIS